MNDAYYALGFATGIFWGYALAPREAATAAPFGPHDGAAIVLISATLVGGLLWAWRRLR